LEDAKPSNMAKKREMKKPEYPKVYHTFNPRAFEPFFHKCDPSCFNGSVDVIQYKITIEVVDEPIEIIHERLEKMWRECDNWHHWQPLETAAKKYNYQFQSKRGMDAPKRT
jgi:hypothetical protein